MPWIQLNLRMIIRQVIEMAGNIFLVNIGVNSSHRAKSPIFSDGTFELMPIPEDSSVVSDSGRTYADLPSYNAGYPELTHFLPKHWNNKPCHNDPDFESFTYGDNCDRVPKAFGLRSVDVRVKGPGAGRECAIRALQTSVGLDVKAIRDVTPIPHNGCRPPKKRRV